MERKFPVRHFRKCVYTCEDVLFSDQFRKMLFHSTQEFSVNSNRYLWSNGERRCTHNKLCIRILLNKLLSNFVASLLFLDWPNLILNS